MLKAHDIRDHQFLMREKRTTRLRTRVHSLALEIDEEVVVRPSKLADGPRVDVLNALSLESDIGSESLRGEPLGYGVGNVTFAFTMSAADKDPRSHLSSSLAA